MRKTVSKKARVLFLGRSDSKVLKYLQSLDEDVEFSDSKIQASSLKNKGYEYCISHGYRHILGRDVLSLFGQRAINLHISLLPYNRGADPNFWSFVDDTPKGVSVHVMSDRVDEGDILAQRKIDIDPKVHTFSSSYALLDRAMVELFSSVWQDIKSGKIKPKPQNINIEKMGGGATSVRFGKSMVANQIRARKSIEKEPYLKYLKNGWDTNIWEFLQTINGFKA